MEKKAWETAMGEVAVDPEDGDTLLAQTKSDRERQRIKRQEDEDKASHDARMAKLEKEKAAAEAAVEKAGDKDDSSGFKVTGHLDVFALLNKQTEELRILKEDSDNSAARTAEENRLLRQEIHEKEMQVMKTSTEAQIQTLVKAVEANASRGNFMEEYQKAIEMAKELGFSQPQTNTNELTAQIELEKLKFEQNMELRRFSREEKRADREFQRLLNKDAADREEAKKEAERQAKRDDMIASAPEVIGGAIAKGLAESQATGGEGISRKAGSKTFVFEAGVGESGEADCPNQECRQPIGIGPTARMAVCANCGTRVSIRRVRGEEETAVEEGE